MMGTRSGSFDSARHIKNKPLAIETREFSSALRRKYAGRHNTVNLSAGDSIYMGRHFSRDLNAVVPRVSQLAESDH